MPSSRVAAATGLASLALAAAALTAPTVPGAGGGADPVPTAASADPAGVELRVGPSGREYYVEPEPEPVVRARVAEPSYRSAETFRLHSMPGAARTIFLDVDGHDVSGTEWNRGFGGIPDRFYGGLDQDGDPTTFDAAERALVQDVWARVAEDFAPFAVDVTTEEPPASALTRSSPDDATFGTRALLTSDPDAASDVCGGGGCVGVAYVDTFDAEGGERFHPAWAFADPLTDDQGRIDAWQLAETVSHEVGHNLALHHDGDAFEEYYPGQGFWTPIMGAGVEPLSQWDAGEYAGAVVRGSSGAPIALQSDLSVIAGAGAPFRADDHGDSVAAGTRPTLLAGTWRAAGVVGRPTDVDVVVVDQPCAGPFSAQVAVADLGPNLDARLRLIGPDGADVVAPSDPGSAQTGRSTVGGLGAALSLATLPAGRWALVVDGVGSGNPAATGYSDYGSLGAWSLTATTGCPDVPGPDPEPEPEPDPDPEPDPVATEPGAPSSAVAGSGRRGGRVTATVRWAAPADDGGAAITSYEVRASQLRDGRLVPRTSFGAGADVRRLVLRLPRGRWAFTVVAVNEVGGSLPSVRTAVVRAR